MTATIPAIVAYAREKLFDPLAIDTHPAFVEPLPDPEAADFVGPGSAGELTPRAFRLGLLGSAHRADLVKLGELYLNDGAWHGRQIVPAEWVNQVTTSSELQPQYGLMWWLYTWNGHRVYAARGYEGHLIVAVPDQKSVTAIAAVNRQEYPMDDEALFPLMNEVIIPTLDGA